MLEKVESAIEKVLDGAQFYQTGDFAVRYAELEHLWKIRKELVQSTSLPSRFSGQSLVMIEDALSRGGRTRMFAG